MDFLYTPLIVFFGFIFVRSFRHRLSQKDVNTLKKLWIFHLMLTIAFYFFTKDGGGDAWTYWIVSSQMSASDFWFYLIADKGTYFIYAFNFLFAGVLGMGFFANTLLFSFFGFAGLVFFYVIALKVTPYNSKFGSLLLFPALFFLPNLHFWSAGVGKDSLSLLAIGLFAYCLLNISRNLPLLIISLLLAYFVRPHIALFLLLAFGIAYLIDSNVGTFKRVFLSLILIGIGIAILPTVLEYAKVDQASVDSFEAFTDKQEGFLSTEETGSRIETSSSYPLKVFAFLYRPFFFDINNIPAVIASFENLLLLLLSIKVIFNKPVETFRKAPFVVKGLILFLVLGALAFSPTLGNIGIMIRMRNMFLPGMLIYFMWVLSYKHQRMLTNK